MHVPDVEKKWRILSIPHYSDRYDMVLGVMARFIRACMTKERSSILEPLTPQDYDLATNVLLLLAMPMTKKLEDDGKLVSLSVFWVEGICYTRGRIGQDDWERIVGQDKLPVLHPKSRLARLFMIKAHQEDHRLNHQDAKWRARQFAWIMNSTNLAKEVVADCQKCKVRNRVLLQQRMSDLPSVATQVPCRPYTHITMDFMGPYLCSSMTSPRSKNKLKCFVLVIVCINTGHINARLCAGYNTQNFLNQFFQHCIDFTIPSFVYTDAGSQLKAGRRVISADKDQAKDQAKDKPKDKKDAKQDDLTDYANPYACIDWTQVADRTSNSRITWKVAPAGAPWRDGRSERAVRALKESLHVMHDGSSLTWEEKQLLLSRACYAVNGRPLGAKFRNRGEPGFCPITPNLLVKGYYKDKHQEELTTELESMGHMVHRIQHLQERHEAWWKLWFQEVFEHLVPFQKWKTTHRNLVPGDVCLLAYIGKVPPAVYRYCKVYKVYPDVHGVVREVDVQLRPRRANEALLPYRGKELTSMRVAVQRLVLILPVDQEPEEAAETFTVKPSAHHIDVWWPLMSETQEEDESHVSHVLCLESEAIHSMQVNHMSDLGSSVILASHVDNHVDSGVDSHSHGASVISGRVENLDSVEISEHCHCLDTGCVSTTPCSQAMKLSGLNQLDGGVDLVPEEFDFQDLAMIGQGHGVRPHLVGTRGACSGIAEFDGAVDLIPEKLDLQDLATLGQDHGVKHDLVSVHGALNDVCKELSRKDY